jgi:hypothetical protein
MTTMHTITNHNSSPSPSTADCGCGCGGSSASPCLTGGSISLERTRYFPRQVVGPEDLTQDQRWIRDKLRRHNRLLHGWGIVCGAGVRQGKGACELVVQPGYILGPYGDEIVIDREVTIDACLVDPSGNAAGPCGDVDPWCSPVRVARAADAPLYLAVRYDECETRPVRVHSCDCGCDDSGCEYSRIRDSFALKLLTELPASYRDLRPPRPQDVWSCQQRGDCPPCPDEPWVILADVTVGDAEIVSLDCFAHRRLVVSFAEQFVYCGVLKDEPLQPEKLQLLEDITWAATPLAPVEHPVMVSARRADQSWTLMPVPVEVWPQNTVADVVRGYGDRRVLDPVTGESYSVRELVLVSGTDPAAPVASTSDFASNLEALDLGRVESLRVVRARVGALIDRAGTEQLDHRLAGPEEALALPATALRGVGADSPLGRRLGALPVAELAAQDPAKLATQVLKGLKGQERVLAAAQLGELQVAAVQLARVGQAWREG